MRAAWSAPDGRARTGTVAALPGTPAEAAVVVWTDRAGTPAGQPIDVPGAALVGIVCGLGVLLVGGGGLAGIGAVVRRVIAARNAAGWAREWERVAPVWSRDLR